MTTTNSQRRECRRFCFVLGAKIPAQMPGGYLEFRWSGESTAAQLTLEAFSLQAYIPPGAQPRCTGPREPDPEAIRLYKGWYIEDPGPAQRTADYADLPTDDLESRDGSELSRTPEASSIPDSSGKIPSLENASRRSA
ncbi:hypothetical protein Ddc_10508 [Ditylenchus destructor]|nr:hypothetical protein Ddc_10508 [Ditylenchus destructor]